MVRIKKKCKRFFLTVGNQNICIKIDFFIFFKVRRKISSVSMFTL